MKMDDEKGNVVDCLRKMAKEQADSIAFTFLESYIESNITFGELDKCAKAIATNILDLTKKGDRVVLLCPHGPDYIRMLFGCFYAGVIVVPLYPPRPNQSMDRVENIISDCGARLALIENGTLSSIDLASVRHKCRFIEIEHLQENAHSTYENLHLISSDVAFLQYTSGSTGNPKGVMVSHENIIANLKALMLGAGLDKNDIFVNWLPLFHDMGLINTVLMPVFLGVRSVLIPPLRFLRSPLIWLEAISNYRGTVAGGPNFSYDLCIERITAAQLDSLDLSTWKAAYNGAEPVRQNTIQYFSEYFLSTGFREEAFYPCYGMAEATLYISGPDFFKRPTIKSVNRSSLHNNSIRDSISDFDSVALVGCGKHAFGHIVKIVDPVSLVEKRDNYIGEIWFSGPSVAKGYWGHPEQSNMTFNAYTLAGDGPFLRTGDLGLISGDEIFVTGRIKDIIIVRGQNYYPQDIEFSCATTNPGLRMDGVVAFGVETDSEQKIVVIQEVKTRTVSVLDEEQVIGNAKDTISREFNLKVEIVLVRSRSLPKTTSGKIQRSLAKSQYLSGKYTDISGRKIIHIDNDDDKVCAGRPNSEFLQSIWCELLNLENFDEYNFFQAGGDSLDATRLLGKVEDTYSVSVGIEEFYDNPTYKYLLDRICNSKIDSEPSQGTDTSLQGSEDLVTTYQVSCAQNRLLLHDLVYGELSNFNVPIRIEITGALNIELLCESFEKIVKQYDILRTGYDNVKGAYVQRVNKFDKLDLEIVDLQLSDDAETVTETIYNKEIYHKFNYKAGQVCRFRVLILGSDRYQIIINIHHIAIDAHSLRVLANQLKFYYKNPAVGIQTNLISYIDYTRWHESYLNDERMMRLSEYWLNELECAPPVLDLPYDYSRPQEQTYQRGMVSYPIDKDIIQNCRALAVKENTSLFMVLLSVFQAFLYRLTGQKDILVGTDAANRHHPITEKLVGFLVNQIVIRVNISSDFSFNDLLGLTRSKTLAALNMQDMPFDKIMQLKNIERDGRASPLFQVKFLLNHSPIDNFTLDNASAKLLNSSGGFSQFDLIMSIDYEEGTGYTANLHYSMDLFMESTAREYLHSYILLLTGLVDNPRISIGKAPMLTQPQLHALKERGQGDIVSLETLASISDAIDFWVKECPDAVAVSMCGHKLTYGQLGKKVERLCSRFGDLGIGKNRLIGIYMHRSFEMVISLLAVIRAGAAFLPLDPLYPAERISYIVEDSNLDILLTTRELEELAPDNLGLAVLFYEDILRSVSTSIETSSVRYDHDDLGYVLYTSGSSGLPKGVKIRHLSLMNLCYWYKSFCNLSVNCKVILVISFGFDASIKNILAPLMSGGELVLFENGPFDPERLNQCINNNDINVINCIPGLFNQLLLVSRSGNYGSISSLDFVILGAESTDLIHLMPWFNSKNCNASMANIYGPTEATDITTAYTYESDIDSECIPIGAPINNVNVVVLNKDGELSFPGSEGELCIDGVGITPGYVGGDSLLDMAFVDHPLDSSRRLYCTGDMVKWNADGQLLFSGRIDQQTKINGVRVNLLEIENALYRCAGIEQVFIKCSDDKISAFLESHILNPPTPVGIREHLREVLTANQIPKNIIVVDSFPRLPNGKIDQKTLSEMIDEVQGSAVISDVEYHAPSTEVEKTLASIWEKVLGISDIGVDHNFFDCGGDSMLAVKASAEAKSVGLEFSVSDLYELQTIHLLAKQCRSIEIVNDADRVEDIAFDMLDIDDIELLTKRSKSK